MNKRIVIALALLIILTTITSQEKITFPKFALKNINIENNSLLKDREIKKLLLNLYDQNLLFLKNKEIEKRL